MRITAIHATDIMPIRRFKVDGLSDVVVLAGPNGVGKTRLLDWLIGFIRRTPSDPNQWITVEATYPFERETRGKPVLDTRDPTDVSKLRATLQRKRKRADQRSTVLNFESDRSISQVSSFNFTWEAKDPFDEEIGWDFGFRSLRDRFQDTQHSIFRKVRSRTELIATHAERLIREAEKSVKGQPDTSPPMIEMNPKRYPDPITPFREAFSQLLAPKNLMDPDPKNQKLMYLEDGK